MANEMEKEMLNELFNRQVNTELAKKNKNFVMVEMFQNDVLGILKTLRAATVSEIEIRATMERAFRSARNRRPAKGSRTVNYLA